MNGTRPAARPIAPAEGRLGVLLVGMGAVSSTFIAGVLLARKGLGRPIGSVTQYGRIRLGKRYEGRNPLVRDFVPLASLDDLVFGGWDVFPDDCYEAACKAGVLPMEMLAPVREELEAIRPWPAVFDPHWVPRLSGAHRKAVADRRAAVEAIAADIAEFRDRTGATRLVMIWCASTEAERDLGALLSAETPEAFEALFDSDEPVPPSALYAYAAIREGIPFANGAPNLGPESPGLLALARARGAPVAGSDFKTGQTLLKTIVAPGLRARALGLSGWFSTNILGNRDGEVLDDPAAFRAKERSKGSVLETILQPELHPELYGGYTHKVRIEYYPPRGDAKEGWDNIDIFGWLDMPMQIKINFLCRDSVLAAPVVLDLVLFLDLAQRAGLAGIQEWLSFFFKSPLHRPDLPPVNDLFQQYAKLQNTLRAIMGEELIHHTGLDYYE